VRPLVVSDERGCQFSAAGVEVGARGEQELDAAGNAFDVLVGEVGIVERCRCRRGPFDHEAAAPGQQIVDQRTAGASLPIRRSRWPKVRE
jgi:hypothetical protein